MRVCFVLVVMVGSVVCFGQTVYEYKYSARALFDGNIIENSWTGQSDQFGLDEFWRNESPPLNDPVSLHDKPVLPQQPPCHAADCVFGRQTWKAALTDKGFVLPTVGILGSMGFDLGATMYLSSHGHYRGIGTNSPCWEQNPYPHPYPKAGGLVLSNLALRAPIIGMGLLATKYRVKWFAYTTAAIVASGKSIHGGIGWFENCN
jgi:hypothetical protein